MTKGEENVSKFYNEVGWETRGDNTEDAIRFEDLRNCAKEYVRKCRLRVLRHIPAEGENMLDMASGPIQYQEYLEYSKNFKKRFCVDLSSKALSDARKRIGSHGEYFHGNFLDMDFQNNFFDCTVSLHTIYHIDKDKQEDAIRRLLAATKPGAPVIIVYSNPDALVRRMIRLQRRLKELFGSRIKSEHVEENEYNLYYYPHPLEFWERFQDIAKVQIFPWRSLSSQFQKKLIPDNRLGREMLSVLYSLEDRFPKFFVRNFQYPMIILRKY